MPNVVIELYPGSTLAQKREMVKRVTDVLVETIHCKREAVRITYHEILPEQIARGGILNSDIKN